MNSNDLKSLISRYKELEIQIEEELEKLPNNGKMCNCGQKEIFYQIFHGHFDEIMRTCIKCGGCI
jgi:hypothetical protein